MSRATIFTVLSLFSLCGLNACKKAGTDSVTPKAVQAAKVWVASYFSSYFFDPKEVDDDETRLLVSFCNGAEPTDVQIGVYELDPGTNLDDALANLLEPHYDGDGELIDREEPDYTVDVQAKYMTPEGVKVSDYNKDKEFVLDVNRSNPVIITYEDSTGFMSYATVDPSTVSRENPPHICLKK